MANSSGTIFINPAVKKSTKSKKSNPAKQKPPESTNDTKTEDEVPDVRQTVKKLEKLVEDDNKILHEVSSVFPFQLFPDKIIVFPTKIVVVHKGLFFKNIFPMLIRDINTVTVTRGLIFASIRFEIRSYEQNPGIINFLWPEHASKTESIILGLLNAIRDKNLDLTKVPAATAKHVVKKLGESKEKIEEIL